MSKLTERQKKYLRTQAHKLKPVVTVGDKGVTPPLLSELASALDHHELLKVSVRAGDREARDAVVAELVEASGATLITRVGNVATLFKARVQDSRISLPSG
jgi:RNA-binding protein